jgi:hypothetical protein
VQENKNTPRKSDEVDTELTCSNSMQVLLYKCVWAERREQDHLSGSQELLHRNDLPAES